MIQKSYIYYPSDDLEKLLFNFIWKIENKYDYNQVEKILPKGTAELIFNISENVEYFNDDPYRAKPLFKSFINGINTKPLNLLKKELQTFIGIQLPPYAIKYIFKIPAIELVDKIIDLFDVNKSTKEIFFTLKAENEFQNQVNIIKKWLYKIINLPFNKIDRFNFFNLNNFRDPSLYSIKTICDNYNISDRHLRRISEEYIGLNPIDTISYRRFLHSLHQIHNYSNETLTQIAYLSGFYDQSHFIRVFKEFTGLSPKLYKNKKSKLIGHIYY